MNSPRCSCSTNSAPRAQRLAALLEDRRESLDELAGRTPAVPDPAELPDEVVAAVAELTRPRERRWVDKEIPMFGARRREVETFLDDLTIDLARSGATRTADEPEPNRELLGLPPRLPR